MKPNPENIQKLVSAARSGEYEQTKGCLRQGNAFCIWGLASEASGLGNWEGSTYLDRCGYRVSDLRVWEEPPREVEEWLGLEFDACLPSGEGLANMNDRGVTFSQLADVLEQDYLTTSTC